MTLTSHWPSRTAERVLIKREADRLVDIVMGRADTRTVVSHYLVIDRDARGSDGPGGGPKIREIEQYRDMERVVSQAADFDTGHRGGKWLGAFTATYVDGKLTSVTLVEDMAQQVKAEIATRPEDRLCPLNKPVNMLVKS